MPGHIAKTDGPDPDPDPWLVVSEELKKKLLGKPYDAKKSCWVPDKCGGYLEGLIESTEGDKVTVNIIETQDVCLTFFIKYTAIIRSKNITRENYLQHHNSYNFRRKSSRLFRLDK